jgi:hypothetical protein
MGEDISNGLSIFDDIQIYKKIPNFPKIFSRIFNPYFANWIMAPFLTVKMSYMGGGYGEGRGIPRV